MKIPIVPLLIALIVMAAAVFVFNATPNAKKLVFAPASLNRIADFDGTETEVAISTDGKRYAVIADGDLWLLDAAPGSKPQRLTQTPEAERFPAWAPDGHRLTFTRGNDTMVVTNESLNSPEVFKTNATSLTWSVTGRVAFVRDRALWLADPSGKDEHAVVPADADPDIVFHTPRFAPDSVQLVFIKSLLNIKGEVWLLDIPSGEAHALIADRPAENPLDVGWIMDGRHLVYLTDRSGAYAIWDVNLGENTLFPLTASLMGEPLGRIGMSVWKDRIVMPRHFVDSDIVISDGTSVVHSEDLEFEPAISPDGTMVAYTKENDAKFEIWTAGIHGENPTFRTQGREPRFSSNGFELVFTHTDILGNPDLWRIDLRNGASNSVTDAEEIDMHPDWSPSGRDIVFASARGGPVSVWNVPADGGKRLRLNDGGYFPRFSPDGKSILYWNRQALWTMGADGSKPQKVRDGIADPIPAVWSKDGPKTYRDMEKPIWPRFDVLRDGRFLIAPIEIRETSLWAVDLNYSMR